MSVLNDKALAISITHRAWSGVKYDNNRREDLHKQFGLKTKATFNVTKNLFGGEDTLLKEIRALGKHCREVSKFFCVGMLSEGLHILPYNLLFPHDAQVKEIKEKHDQKVVEFCDTYASRVADAVARSNGAVNASDFPSASEMEGKFELEVDIHAIPSSSALDKILGKGQAEVVAKAEKKLQDKVDESVANVFDRVHTTLEDLINIKKAQGFRPNSLNKIEALVNILPELNFSGDQRIAQIADACADFVKDARHHCGQNYCEETMNKVKSLATSLNIKVYNTKQPAKQALKKTKIFEKVKQEKPPVVISKTKQDDMASGFCY